MQRHEALAIPENETKQRVDPIFTHCQWQGHPSLKCNFGSDEL